MALEKGSDAWHSLYSDVAPYWDEDGGGFKQMMQDGMQRLRSINRSSVEKFFANTSAAFKRIGAYSMNATRSLYDLAFRQNEDEDLSINMNDDDNRNARCALVASKVSEKLSTEHGAALLEVNSTVQGLASKPYRVFTEVADRAGRAVQSHLPSMARKLNMNNFRGFSDAAQGFFWTYWNYIYSLPTALAAKSDLATRFNYWVGIITFYATIIANLAFSGFNRYMCPRISAWMEKLDEGNSTVDAEEGFRKGHAGVEACMLRDENSKIRRQVLDRIKVVRVFMTLRGLPESSLPEVHSSPVHDRDALIKERDSAMQNLMKELDENIICVNPTLLDSIIEYPWQDVVEADDANLAEVLPGIVACMCKTEVDASTSSKYAALCGALEMNRYLGVVEKDHDLNKSMEIPLEVACSDAASRTDVNEHFEQQGTNEQRSNIEAETSKFEENSFETTPSKVKDDSFETERSEVEEDIGDGEGRGLQNLRQLALENDITSMDQVRAQPPDKVELESEGTCV
eukprot:TRINITY_DN23970_c0_g4_i1.p1 TRINITY_DN23970_c0_g4~~TRINITY_DN23970_c0_g4_i1.p1  ORF type:complete len:536 (-),score=62.57 TRINITY_DN23970_c0_g4_i1:254-1795(-)